MGNVAKVRPDITLPNGAFSRRAGVSPTTLKFTIGHWRG